MKYLNNVHAGDATIIVTGIGNYAGSAPVSINFKINPQKISKASVKGTISKGIKKTLVKGVDYELTYGEEKKNTIQVTITGLNKDFTGTVKKNIKKK